MDRTRYSICQTGFAASFIGSVFIHSALLAALAGIGFSPPSLIQKKPLAVDYFISDRPKTPQRLLESKRMEIRETVKLEPALPVATKAVPQKDESRDEETARLAKDKQEKAKADYISYYQLIREKMRRCLKAHYKDKRHEGEIYLIFRLDSSGRLLESNFEPARSSSDKVLIDMALASLREASPFPPFPETLTTPSRTFHVVVTFRKK